MSRSCDRRNRTGSWPCRDVARQRRQRRRRPLRQHGQHGLPVLLASLRLPPRLPIGWHLLVPLANADGVCVCVMWIVCDQIEIGEICIIIIHEIRMDIKGWIYTQNAGALCDMRGDFSLCMRYLWFPLWRSIYHYECTNTCNSKYSYVNAGTAIIPHTKPREERKRNLPIRAGENGSFHSNYAWAAPRISC